MKAERPLISHGGQMSDKEEQMLSLLARGGTTRQIADTIGISTHYVYYLSRLLKARFGVDTHAAVVSRAIAEGIISPDGQILRTLHSTIG